MDHGFQRPTEMWELSDGVIFILSEVSSEEFMQDFVVSNLENLSNLGYIDHFKHCHVLKENLFNSLILILRGLGKKKFRGHVELFLDPAFRNAKSLDKQNMAIAAQEFIMAMEKMYGENIFKAIVESHDDRYLKQLSEYKLSKVNVQTKDFIYPLGGGMSAEQVAKNQDIMLTKAPWAK